MRFTFEDLVAVMARLRGPEGCPWDREQTHGSLAPFLLEETHEVLDAIGRGDQAALRDELGDLLLQVVFHGQMSGESGGWTAADIVDGLTRKLIDRHPHVFGDVRLETPGEVLAQWHALKRREAPFRGAFDGIPDSLPALARAQKLVSRALTNGLAADLPDEPLRAAALVAERLHRAMAVAAQEVDGTADRRRASDAPRLADAFGDLLLAAVMLAETVGIDAESALRDACRRFLA